MEILTLGQKIKKRRKELNITLKELAGDRITPAQLSYVEADKSKPSLDLLEYIAQKLGLEMDYLLESEKMQVKKYCQININISKLEIYLNEYESAKERLYKVLELSDKYGYCCCKGEAQACIAKMYQHKGDYIEAFRHYLTALHEFSKIQDIKKVSIIFLNLGLLMYDMNCFESSLLYFKQAQAFAYKLDDTDILLKSKVCYYLAVVYNAKGQNELATVYADACLNGFNDFFAKGKYAETCLKSIKSFEEKNRYADIFEYLDKFKSACGSPCGLFFLAESETNLGKIYGDGGMIEKSFEHLNRAVCIKKSVQNDDDLFKILLYKAYNHIRMGQYNSAEEIMNDLMENNLKCKNSMYEFLLYKSLFLLNDKKGDLNKAEENIKRCIEIGEDIGYENMRCLYFEACKFYKKINRKEEEQFYISKAVDNISQSIYNV